MPAHVCTSAEQEFAASGNSRRLCWSVFLTCIVKMQLCKKRLWDGFGRYSTSLGCYSRTVFGTKRLDLFCAFLQIKPSGPRQQSRKVSQNKHFKTPFRVKFDHSFYFFLTGGQAVWTRFKSPSIWSESVHWGETSQKALHIQAVEHTAEFCKNMN